MSNAIFNFEGDAKIFDVYDFYKKSEEGYSKLGNFGITVWYTQSTTGIDNKCRAINFTKLLNENYKEMVKILSHCISLGIQPDIDEIMEMDEIPLEWVYSRINRLNDFYLRYDCKSREIWEIIEYFDNHIDLKGNDKIKIKVASGDTKSSSNFGDKSLYTSLRENLDFTKLKNFDIEFVLYLSEIVQDGNIDANTVLRKILKLEKETNKKYNHLVYDVKNLLNTNNSVDVAAEVVKTAYKHGILVDFSKDSEDFEVHVYTKLYRKICNFSSVENFKNSLRQIYDAFGDDFYLSVDFRKYYPVKLIYFEKEDGSSEIRISGNATQESDLELDDLNTEYSREIEKLSTNLYKVNPSLLLGINCPYRLISSAYVIEDGREYNTSDRPKLLFLG